ncbi:hypothetical protein AK812_SmicGene23659 [Symbiodinium microadriaticum]|uniref:Uncharacterized protein n=1 Tax=Symbiodinium microadriaticum TaxID=2951 RepID=A0A1Q9DGL2_SYMMI|nr:hypothetical protein AK812_SmicGene23659 [Symbiodinium microadriaticum]
MDADNVCFNEKKEEDIDTDELRGIFRDKAWVDLPLAIKMNGHPNFDYKSQLLILSQNNGKLTIVNFLTKIKLTQAKLTSFAVGACSQIVWGSGNKVLERKAFQRMLQQMGGLQSLTGERKRSASSAALGTCTEADQDAGWDSIIEHEVSDWGQLKQLRWIHKHINQEGSPIRGWAEKLVPKALDSLANDGCLAKLTRRYDLTIQDFHPTFLDNIFKDAAPYHSRWLLGEPGVGKTPLARVTAMMFSRYHGGGRQFRSAEDFDFFRGIFFSKATPALYDDGDISGAIKAKRLFPTLATLKGSRRSDGTPLSSRRASSASSSTTPVPHMELSHPKRRYSHMVSRDDFIKMILPAIGCISDVNSRAILKRRVFMVFTKDSIYYRPFPERRMDMRRHKWALQATFLLRSSAFSSALGPNKFIELSPPSSCTGVFSR